MSRHSLLMLAVAATFLPAFSVPARAADVGCKPVFAAMEKLATTPNHQFMTEIATPHSKPTQGEVITTASMSYVRVSGAWHSMPYDAQQRLGEMRQTAAAGNTTCKYVRDEAISGESSALYSTQDKQEDGDTVNSRIWISKSRGLPLRQSIDIDVGGASGKSHHDVRFDYANVSAPAGGK